MIISTRKIGLHFIYYEFTSFFIQEHANHEDKLSSRESYNLKISGEWN